MKEYSYKSIFLLSFFYQLYFLESIWCKNTGKDKYEMTKKKDDDFIIPEILEELENLKSDIQDLSKDIAKYDTLIYVLIPTAIILFLIFIGLLTFEIVKKCRKKSQSINEQNRNSSDIYADNNNNQYINSENLKTNQILFSKSSLSSSDVYESNDISKTQNFLNQQNENIEESKDFNKGNINSFEAPVIGNSNNNKQEVNFLTNRGENDKGEDEKYKNISNPFLKK